MHVFRINSGTSESQVPPSDMTFEVVFETNVKQIYRLIQRALQDYREDHKGPTFCAVQSTYSISTLLTFMPGDSETHKKKFFSMHSVVVLI